MLCPPPSLGQTLAPFPGWGWIGHPIYTHEHIQSHIQSCCSSVRRAPAVP